MKICIIQPAYSTDLSQSDTYFAKLLDMLEQCDETMDMIVLPEMCDIPCLASSKEASEESVAKFNAHILEAAARTAQRCSALVFVNARSKSEKGLRNTTYAFGRDGGIVGTYDKQHLVPAEVTKLRLDSDYSFEFSEPTVLEIEGLRFGFLVCYDFYFYEAFANMARKDLDIIIGCSHQRSDTHDALEIMSRFLAYNTNAYVVRSSVSMGEDSPVGGASMIVAPTGKVLANLYSQVGMATVDIDPTDKYYKPAGFGNPPSAHYEYIEKGRRPWKYRPAGSAIVRHDEIMPYPRVCAHRGFNTVAPENSLPAFGAAVAMGAEEIEFDLWETDDGEAVVIHDPVLDRVSNGTGRVSDHTLAQLRALDFGVGGSAAYEGIQIPTFEEVLRKFSCHCIMNIHLQTPGKTAAFIEKVVSLIKKYDCEKYVYFTTGDEPLLARLRDEYPSIPRCACGDGGEAAVDRAVRFGCKKLQFAKDGFDQSMIDRAHASGIICQVSWSDDPTEVEAYLDRGIDVILTNGYHAVAEAVARREKYKTY